MAIVLVAPHGTAAQQSRGTVAGTIRDSSGGVVVRAEVVLEVSGARTLTDARGAYRLHAVPAGPARLQVRRLGFRPATLSIDVAPAGVTAADIRLSPVPLRLASVEVRERREVYDARLAGFNERRARKGGHFITRERLDRTHSFRFTDVLREVPGVRIGQPRGGGPRMVRLRGAGCPPIVFVDGFPASAGEFDLDMIDLSTVEGIEIYPSSTSVPAEFLAPRGLDRCGLIAVWSRPAPARPSRRARRESVDLRALVDSQRVYTSDDVERPARLQPGTVLPDYPDSLWRASVAGHVVMEFVVDTAGVVEPATIGVVSSTHPALGEAVRTALHDAHFDPAIRGGRPVRQVVQLPFRFEPRPGPRPKQ